MARPVRLVFIAGLLLIIFYFLKESVFSDSAYVAGIKKERQDKNQSFRSSNSPLEEADRATFDSLSYYVPGIIYRVNADYKEFSQPETVQMPMNTGGTEPYLRFAKATFNLEGQQNSLILYLRVNTTDSSLFVPFSDKTNGLETYEGGRFMDIPKPEPGTNQITLDFNKAYNPFCVYNYNYSCPVPPPSNRLPVSVRAGEKSYTKR
ncbi:hypothetical protein AAE02nite_43510 [Adhaeribacter aerolatus]|uniref:DUF1684 domain-containing protein n=1 Tax=Adhaeribacter aerolatus TaxID=670289 RepID=A0A512B4J3_9BACT|nr:DUF1684 domain-containing protein [Adhaeribacter aerolatus]GEO06687.1 hypothetical protein AAE02nite_43510 [Adhaeribacter aerolatus]